jgi:tripartite-type tricarboxylate transporter receptor subunit TctC
MLNRQSLFAIAFAFLLAPAAYAQPAAQPDYPSKPIRFIIPFAAGGPVDVLGRGIGQKMAATFGQQMLLDNRPGGNTIIALDLVAKSPPDGYMILLASGAFTTLASFNKSLPFDPLRDFTPVTMNARIPGFLLVTHPSLPARSVKELIAIAKTSPDKLNYGSSGHGGVQHLAMSLFALSAGTKMTHIVYKGAAPLSVDLVAGHVDTAFMVPAGVLEYVRAGRLRALGFSGLQRWNKLPDVPTIDEAAIKGYEYYTWYGFWYPAGVPAAYVTKLHAETVKAVAAPDVRKRFDDLGFEGIASDKPADFAKFVQDDMAAVKKLASQIGFVPQ